MKRFILPILILLVAMVSGFHILSLWRGSEVNGPMLSPEDLLQANLLAPLNPDPYYRLGIFHQLEIHHLNLLKSLEFFGKAIERNPLEQEYWLNLAKILHRMGEAKAGEWAMEKAILVFPTGYPGRWTVGNLLLQQGQYEKAVPHFSYLLAHYPDRSSLVYDVWRNVTRDPDFYLEKLVPQNPSAYRQYLSYLYEAGDKEMAKKAWQKRASLGFKAERSEAIHYLDFLISRGELAEAYRTFVARLGEEGFPKPSGENLIVNGGFEKEKLLGGGFDWKIESVPGAQISFDPTVAFEGKRSLKISFDGKENVDFHQVFQFVALKPNHKYLLRAQVKTKALTTKSGIKVEVIGIGPAFYGASEPLTGDSDWKELTVPFSTPIQSQGGMVRFRRERTDRFDRFISGTVWVDHVRLSPFS